jgi:hypothetical protein
MNETTSSLLTPQQLATWLQVDVSYVYSHSGDLGAVRLPSAGNARPRLRFDLDEVRRRIACSAGRESDPAQTRMATRNLRGRRTASTGTSAVLLPIRGRKVA